MSNELANFRAKYPGYNDMDDATLASKLAAKYPDAYGDLPGKIKSSAETVETPGYTTDPNKIEAARQKFVSDTGTTTQRASEYLPSRKTVATWARPLLEAGGVVGGGILGTGAAPGVGTVAGAGLGYGIGKKTADIIEGAGAPKYTASPLANEFIGSVGDVATGATMEMGGQLLAKGAGAALSAAKKLPFTEARAKINVGNALEDIMSSADPLKAATTENVLERVGATAKPTPGQATGSIRAAALEQSMAAKDPAFAERLKLNDAALNESALANLQRVVGRGGPLPATQPAQVTGSSVLDTIDSAKGAAKTIHEKLYRELPNTPLATDDIAATVKALKADFRAGDESVYPASTIAKIEELVSTTPKTAHSHGHGQKIAAPEFGAADIQTWAEKQALPKEKPEVGFQDLHSLRKDIGRQIDSALSGANPNRELAMKLGKIKESIDRTIETNLGTNEAYQAAKNAYIDYAQKFNTGAVRDVTQKGRQITGLRTPEEAVPAKFFTPSGADDLIRSVGQVTAKRQMLPHVTEQLTGKAVSADGVMHIPRAMAYLRQNKEVLDKLGLSGEVKGIIREQIPAFLRAQIESKGVDIAGNPVMTARQAAKMVRDMAPAMKAAYPDGKALAALRDYHKVLDIVGRNKGVSYSGNSTSIEKLFGDAPIESFGGKLWKNLSDTLVGHVLAGGAIGSAVGGPVGGAVGVGAGVLSKTASEHYRKVAASLMQDAITNPETADMLMKIARGAKIPAAAIDSRLMSLGIVGSSNIGSSTPDESASMTDGGTAPTEYTYENGELVPR